MQSPRANNHSPFHNNLLGGAGGGADTMPSHSPTLQSVGLNIARTPPLRYVASMNSAQSPAHHSPLATASSSMFPIPPVQTGHQREMMSNVVGPSDHYGTSHQQHFKSLDSPNLLAKQQQHLANGLSMPIAKQTQQRQMDETKVCVIVDSRTPVLIKVPVSPDRITLADLKRALPAVDRPTYKYFFKSNDSEFGIVREEIQEDDSHLPTYRNRVVAWIVTPNRDDTDDLASRFRSETSDTCNLTYTNTSYDDNSSIFTTDLESSTTATSYFTETDETDDSCSNYSETTCDTFISQRRNNNRRATNGRSPVTMMDQRNNRTNNHHHHHNHQDTHDGGRLGNLEAVSSSSSSSSSNSSRSSSSSSQSSNAYSDATAVHCVTVHLVLTNENFLGLHIYANAVNGVDEGIYVDGVTENSAVALDGRIEPGDKLIQVNDQNLEELTNDEAVKVLKEAVIRRGPLKLVVAKFVETNNNNNKNDPIAGLKEAIHPINTAAWVAHAQAMTIHSIDQEQQQQQQQQASDCQNNSATSSPSFGSNAQDTDCIRPATQPGLGRLGPGLRLSKDSSDMKDIVMHMKMPTIGLDIRDRKWLKIHIPNAFLGSDLVKWLERNVHGFLGECDARKFAAKMLEQAIIQDPLSKNQFSTKSFYTFV